MFWREEVRGSRVQAGPSVRSPEVSTGSRESGDFGTLCFGIWSGSIAVDKKSRETLGGPPKKKISEISRPGQIQIVQE
jgi:hypothetical protein